MKDEIFGPILSVYKVKDVDDAISMACRVKPDPLTLFIFSRDRAAVDK